MGAMTRLSLRAGIRIGDIKSVLEDRLFLKVKKCAIDFGLADFDFELDGEGRSLNVSLNADGGIDLWFAANSSGQRLLRQVGQVLGGFYVANDSAKEDGSEDFGDGMLGGNGLPFYVRAAIIGGTMQDEDDLRGLLQWMAGFEAVMERPVKALQQVRDIERLDFVKEARQAVRDRELAEANARFKKQARKKVA